MKFDLSIVIVSFNSLVNLETAVNSIKEHNSDVSIEIIIVAYLFSEENLTKLKRLFNEIKIIENNEIAGFAANNNLALIQAQGEYCLILNDDTYFIDQSITILLQTMKSNDEVSILSPVIYYPNGELQFNGAPENTFAHHIVRKLRLRKRKLKENQTKSVLFRTYNISGSCFMIKTEIFRRLGFFDTEFFFSPEDIALSTKANRLGLGVFVQPLAHVYHIHSGTASKIYSSLMPVIAMGDVIFHTKYNSIPKFIVKITWFFISLIKILIGFPRVFNKNGRVILKGHFNILFFIFKEITPKDIFKQQNTKLSIVREK